MHKIKAKRRKIITILAAWLICMGLSGVLMIRISKRDISREARHEMISQMNLVAKNIPALLQNDYYSYLTSMEINQSKVQALSFGLKDKEDLAEVKDFLDDFAREADIDGMAMYDRSGKLLYITEDYKEPVLDREAFERCWKDDLDESLYDYISGLDAYRSYCFSADVYKNDHKNQYSFLKAGNGQWLCLIDSGHSSQERIIREEFDWREALQLITVGENGQLIAVEENTGMLLSFYDAAFENKSVELLNIRAEGQDQAATWNELQEMFKKPNQIIRIEMDGDDYYAARLKVEDLLLLELLPTDELDDVTDSGIRIRILLLCLMTGIFGLYIFFHISDGIEAAPENRTRLKWNHELYVKLSACGILIGAAMFLMCLCLEFLLINAETYQYGSNTVDESSMTYRETEAVKNSLNNWFSECYLTRGRIAGTILSRAERGNVTWEYLQELSDCLNIRYIYVFDAKGRIKSTNSPYDHLSLERKISSFHELLEGRPEMIGEMIMNGVSDDPFLCAGVSMRDEAHKFLGGVLILNDLEELEEISASFRLTNYLEQLLLKKDTRILVVNEEDKIIVYNAEMSDGSLRTRFNSYDLVDIPFKEVFQNAVEFMDDYDGSRYLLGEKYFVFIRRNGGYFFIAAVPWYTIGVKNVARAVLTTAAALLIMLLLGLLSCVNRAGDFCMQAVSADEVFHDFDVEEPSGNGMESQSAVTRTVIDSLVNRNKPSFEDRWPQDATRWRDKTSDQKFSIILWLVLILVFVGVFVNAVIAGEESLWFYVLDGDWDPGLNIHSVTACLLYICVLVLVKKLLHKILYLAARVANSEGESICQFIDSSLGYILGIAGIIVCLSIIGVNTATISLTAGVTGLLFSIGCQSIVADILAGFLMAFEGDINVGDFLFFDGKPADVLNIGVRTTKLKFFSEVTVVRNNDFRNYVLRPADKDARVAVMLFIDLNESLEHVESILTRELPEAHDRIAQLTGVKITGPDYRGVNSISEKGMELLFELMCPGKDAYPLLLALNRELKLIFDRHDIRIALPHVVVR